MKLTIAHKIIISICGVLAFAFLNSAFAIYSEYTAAKTSEIHLLYRLMYYLMLSV